MTDNIAVTAAVIVLAAAGLLVIGAGLISSALTGWTRATTALRNYRPRPKRKRRH